MKLYINMGNKYINLHIFKKLSFKFKIITNLYKSRISNQLAKTSNK